MINMDNKKCILLVYGLGDQNVQQTNAYFRYTGLVITYLLFVHSRYLSMYVQQTFLCWLDWCSRPSATRNDEKHEIKDIA